MAVTLSIGRRFVGEVESLAAAQLKFCKMREESGDGASTFPDGKVKAEGKAYRISYNGRLWDGDSQIAEAPDYAAYA